jgi:hypothetical protein
MRMSEAMMRAVMAEGDVGLVQVGEAMTAMLSFLIAELPVELQTEFMSALVSNTLRIAAEGKEAGVKGAEVGVRRSAVN